MNKLKSITPVSEVLFPYYDELREKYGSEVYEIDRYVEVFKIRHNVWAMLAPCTHPVGDNWIYLIEGPEKALFIDNGFGVGNLKGLGEMLTGKPVLCAVTHSHGDHAGGSNQWDEVYCHKYCAEILDRNMDDPVAEWKRFNWVGREGHYHYYDDEDIIELKPYKAIGLDNHTIINLGEDYDIELIHMGGHTPGNCCFLDKKSRILYSGDTAFESRIKGLGVGLHNGHPGAVHPECLGIAYYSKQIAELAKRVNEFDYIMAGHGYMDSPTQCITDIDKAVKAVIADPYCYDAVVERHLGKTYIKEGGLADVMYTPEEVIENLRMYY